MADLEQLKKSAQDTINGATTSKELETVRIAYEGRNGIVNEQFASLKTASSEEKKSLGPALNEFKKYIHDLLVSREQELLSSAEESDIDISLPGVRQKMGQLHPHTIIRREMNGIFKQMGFSVYEGPHIETDEYVFERANLPKHHPARSLQDTIIIDEPEVILRSHTSSVENRAMENEELPLRIVVPGVAFRYETPNQTNHFLFYQYEGMAIAEDISMADLHGAFESFCKSFFGPEVKIRIRAKYYPQVEPGCGLDLICSFCQGKGCPVCKKRGWVEISGGGMIHANMLRTNGIDPDKYSGFAWGMGFDRMVMQKLKIDDIRKLYDGTLI
jgi:phenylalanyl-tRNA synthetase alpha chain